MKRVTDLNYSFLKKRMAGYFPAVLGIAGVTAICTPLHAQFTDTTVALAMLLVVLLVALIWGSLPAVVASVLGMLCFNYFFLPPIGTFTIADPENWIALAAFFVTSLTVGHLSARAKQSAAALSTERRRLLDVLDELPAHVVLLTRDYHVAFANRCFRQRFGESRGQRCFEYLFGRSQPCEVCHTYKVLDTLMPARWEWTGPDGRNYDIFDFPFTDTDGSTLILEMGLDISERKRAENEIRSLVRLQTAVAELGQQALQGYRLDEFFDQTVAMVTRNLDVEYSKVLELLPDGAAFLLRAGVGWKDGLIGRATVGAERDSQAGFTLLSGHPVIVHDLRTEERFSGPKLLRDHGVVSGMSVIITTSAGPYGVLGAHTRQRRTFSKDEVHFLQAIANLLGNMIERQSYEEALQKSADEIRDLYNHAPCGYHSLDPDGVIVRMNDTELSWLGYTRDELIGRIKLCDLLTPESARKFQQEYPRFKAQGEIRNLEFDLVRKNGSILPALVSATALTGPDGHYLMSRSTVYDITARKRWEQEIRRISRTNRALSRCNEAVIRAVDESTLLQQICDIVIQEAGYRLCWVGRAEHDENKSVRPISQAGIDDGYLAALNVTWANSERGRGPTGTCIRTGQPVHCKNIATDPRMSLWRAEALKRGYASSLVIPLLVDSGMFGALSIYASEPDGFADEEVKLLTELANDLAFGISALRTRAEHTRAEAEILALNAGLEQRVADRTAELQAANAAIERAREREFEIGFRIQQALLLDLPPVDVPGLQVAALSLPSQRIDGDFYAFFKHRDQSLDIIVGDVMGKGIPAALLGAATKSQFLHALSSLLAGSPDAKIPQPKEIVGRAHSDIVSQLIDLDSFVTLCYARLDVDRRRLELVDCGHPGTIHWHARTGRCEILQGDNLPLGVSPGEVYRQISRPFELGDLLLFYSDGITEARSPAGELFGVDRLQECVRCGGEIEPEALIEQIRRAVAEFSGSERLADDLTTVVVRATAHAEIDISSNLGELRRAREFVCAFCREAPGPPLGPDRVSALELAVHEAAANIMKYAYHGRTDRWIHLDGDAFPGHVSIHLHHFGDPFDPAAVPPPAFDGSRESGFGTYIISRSVDVVRYYQDRHSGSCVALVQNHRP